MHLRRSTHSLTTRRRRLIGSLAVALVTVAWLGNVKVPGIPGVGTLVARADYGTIPPPSPTSSGWTAAGNAVIDTSGGITLTPCGNCGGYMRGSGYWNTPIRPASLTASFNLTIDQPPTSGTGADGATFMLADASNAPTPVIGGVGGGLGFFGLSGRAVTFTENQAPWGCYPSDHFLGVTDGGAPPSGCPLTYLTTNATIPALLPATHAVSIQVTWTPTPEIKVSMDGTQYLDYVNQVPLPPSVFVGFSAADGIGAERHYVSNVNINYVPMPPTGGAPTAAEGYGGGSPSVPHLGACQACYAKPVNSVSGNFFHTFADIAIPGRGIPLAFTHTYNSMAAGGSGPLGYGWTHSYNMSLSVGASSVTVNEEGGSQVVFNQSGSTYSAAPRVIATLVKNADGTYTFTRGARQKFVFSSAGLVVSETDLNGYATTLGYNAGNQLTSITDPAGRSLSLAYTGTQLTTVTDPIGRHVSFAYNDGLGNLTDVTDVGGGLTHFTYDGSHRMLTMTDPRGGVVTNVYDAQGRVASQSDQLQRKTTFAYAGDNSSAAGGSTTITDPQGNVTVEQYEYNERLAVTRGSGRPVAATWNYKYDLATLGPTSVTDPNGHVTTRTFDAQGNVLTVADALGRTTTMAYDALNDLTSLKDANGVTTTLTYDARGNLLSRSTPLVGTSPLQTQTTSYQYGDASHPGDVTAMVDPNGNTWAFAYDARGDVARATDPLSNATLNCNDAVGRRTATTTPKGTAVGVTCTSAAPAAFTTYVTYTAFDDVASSTDSLGHQATWTHDADRNVTASRDPDGNLTQSTFDAANQRTDVLRADGTKLQTDYNADGTVHDQVDGAGHATTYGYDAMARLASTTTPATATCPTGCTTSYTYDGAGNRRTLVDAQGQTATFAYDTANELTGITYSDNRTPNVTGITYDADGQRTAMTDGTGTSHWTWDSLHRMTSSQNGAAQLVKYGYDLKGQMTSLTYPNRSPVNRQYDTAGRLTAVTDWLGHTTTFTPDADANVTSQVYPNNTTATQSFDGADRLTSVADTATGGASPFASFSYARDANDQITAVTSSGVPPDSNTYTYTGLNQLKSISSTPYSYDSADNLTQTSDGTLQGFDAANELTSTHKITPAGTPTTAGDLGTSKQLTVALPDAVQAGDQIIVVNTQNGSKSPAAPFGYSLVGEVASGGTLTDVWNRTATADDVGSKAATITYADYYAKSVVVALYRGVDPTTPIDTTSTAATTGSLLTATSVTASIAGERLVMAQGAAGQALAASWAAPAGMNEWAQKSEQPLTAAALADQALSASGATGARTAGFGSSTVSGVVVPNLSGLLFTLRPALVTYGYDARGNRTSMASPFSGTTTLAYDQANRLTAYGTAGTYTYDGDGRRATKIAAGSTEQFAWDVAEGLPLLLVDGTTNYIYGPGGEPIEEITSEPSISLVGATGTLVVSGSVAPSLVTLPAGIQPSDLILVASTQSLQNGQNHVDPPQGYTQVASVTAPSSATATGAVPANTVLFDRVATGGEKYVVIPQVGAFPMAVTVAVYRGVDRVTPLDGAPATGSTSSGTTVTVPSLSPIEAGDRLVLFTGAGASTNPVWTVPVGMSSQAQDVGNVGSAMVADQPLAAAGATGQRTATYGATASLTGILLALKQPQGILYFHHDQLGSTRVLTDKWGSVAGTYTYDPYGAVTATTATEQVTNSLGFAGQYRDSESGFYYLRARYYDPTTAQLVSRDPLASMTGEPYGYVGDNPVNGADPSGLCVWIGCNVQSWLNGQGYCTINQDNCGPSLITNVPGVTAAGHAVYQAEAPDAQHDYRVTTISGPFFSFSVVRTQDGSTFFLPEGSASPLPGVASRQGVITIYPAGGGSRRATCSEVDQFVGGFTADIGGSFLASGQWTVGVVNGDLAIGSENGIGSPNVNVGDAFGLRVQ